jgi:hypothetical protein
MTSGGNTLAKENFFKFKTREINILLRPLLYEKNIYPAGNNRIILLQKLS